MSRVHSFPATCLASAGDIARTLMPLGQKMGYRGPRSLQPKEIQTRCSPKQSEPWWEGEVMLSHIPSFDGSRCSAASSCRGSGIQCELGEFVNTSFWFSCGVTYPSEKGDFNTFSERKSNKYFPLPGQILQLCFCKRRIGYSDSYN